MTMHSGDGGRSRKPKNGPKKQPQRGLGVAQLEKLRLQEQCRQQQFLPAAFQDQSRSIASSSAGLLDAMSRAASSRNMIEELLQQHHQMNSMQLQQQQQQRPLFSWKNKDSSSVLFRNQQGRSVHSFMDATRPPDLRGRPQLELAEIGTPSIGNKPEELSSFQIYQTSDQNARLDNEQAAFENKRQRVESWLCLDGTSSYNNQTPHFTTGLVRNALGNPCRESAYQPSCKKGSLSSEPASEVEAESSFLALGPTSSESSKSILHTSSEDDDRGSNNQNGDRDVDNSSSGSGSHVQPCMHWVQIGSKTIASDVSLDQRLDLNLRLSL